ncbi:MAG TPA: glycosyltransferase, partial [bacterium]|nr:glycosyltransferase [bacterium]
MRLVIQIPCYNEAEHLPATIADLPKKVVGIDEITVLVIDDGSKDDTSGVARSLGAKVVRHTANRGLAAAFMTGLQTAIELDADLKVGTPVADALGLN